MERERGREGDKKQKISEGNPQHLHWRSAPYHVLSFFKHLVLEESEVVPRGDKKQKNPPPSVYG